MSEALKSIYASFNNRLKNPFLGTLIFTIVTYNWKVIFHIFSDYPSDFKIKMIELHFYQLHWWDYVFIWLLTLTYMIFPKWMMFLIEKEITNKIEENRYKNAANKTLAKYKVQKIDALERLTNKHIEENEELKAEISEKDQIIEDINQRLKNTGGDRMTAMQTITKLKNIKEDIQKRLDLSQTAFDVLEAIDTETFNLDNPKIRRIGDLTLNNTLENLKTKELIFEVNNSGRLSINGKYKTTSLGALINDDFPSQELISAYLVS